MGLSTKTKSKCDYDLRKCTTLDTLSEEKLEVWDCHFTTTFELEGSNIHKVKEFSLP